MPRDDQPGCSYLPDYLSSDRADGLQELLTHQINWRCEQISMFGRLSDVPRLVAWCGDPGVGYRYSGNNHQATGWPASLKLLADDLSTLLQQRFNFVLLNRYRSGQDYMGWHTDDEPGVDGQVASVSLGAARDFLLRSQGSSRSRRLRLTHGSLLVFDPALRHSLPKRAHAGERFNLTFRSINHGACRA